MQLQGDHKTNCEGCITHGPWGRSDGKNWIYKPNGFIRKITIVHGWHIDGIKFYSRNTSTGETESSFFGVKVGKHTDEIFIDQPNEYLTSISGTFDSYAIKSLCFGTNQKQYGPYGDAIGTLFSYEGEGEGVIAGFHGRASGTPFSPIAAIGTPFSHIAAIGIYVIPESYALGLKSSTSDNSIHELCSRMTLPRDPGPWGASGGKPWDDGVFSTVKQVHIHVGESLNVIYAIQFEYIHRDAKSVLSPMHGGTRGDKVELVNLDGVDEYLTGISGFYGPVKGYNGLEAIMSITFHTNKKIHGPYGLLGK